MRLSYAKSLYLFKLRQSHCRLPRPPHSRRWTRTIILTTEVHRNGSLDSAVGILRARSACFTSFSIGRTRHLKNLDSAFLLSWRRCRETQQKNLLRFPKVTIREVLPALAKLLRGSDSPDARFLALKLTCDSMLPLLALQPVKIDYENARSNAEEMREEAARGDANSVCQIDADDKRYLTESLRMDFLPSCPALLMDEDPIPLYALKLLAGSMNNCGAEEEENANARGDEALEKALAHFASKFFAFLSLDHANNNAHNARLCLFLCRSKNSILSTRKLFTELSACERVADVLVYSRENRVEPFVEPASKMCEVLAKRAMQALEDTNTDSAEGEDLIDASLRGMLRLRKYLKRFSSVPRRRLTMKPRLLTPKLPPKRSAYRVWYIQT